MTRSHNAPPRPAHTPVLLERRYMDLINTLARDHCLRCLTLRCTSRLRLASGADGLTVRRVRGSCMFILNPGSWTAAIVSIYVHKKENPNNGGTKESGRLYSRGHSKPRC